MKVLIVGGGGREHALAWKAAQSGLVDTVYVAPGNAGTATENKVRNVAIGAEDIHGLVEFAAREAIDLTIIGPEKPLANGIVDAFRSAGLRCFGPTREAAALEASKAFAKAFLHRHHIPSGEYRDFAEVDAALAYLRDKGVPIVIKADGLAAGKGVIVAHTEDDATEAVRNMLALNRFGSAGSRIIIEEFLQGEEVSFIVMTDGRHILPLASSQDHKTRDDGDRGPNTGGMGAYSPAPAVTPEMHARIMREIIAPAVRGMAEEHRDYLGFLYAGVIITKEGEPRVLEFNCRFGDPETQPILMRLKSDLIELCNAALAGKLNEVQAEWDPRPALGVVLAAANYPSDVRTGDMITGLDSDFPRSVKVFHAGTRAENGRVVTAGGRVLCATALGATVTHAQQTAYGAIGHIHWNGMFYRRDIGYRAMARESGKH